MTEEGKGGVLEERAFKQPHEGWVGEESLTSFTGEGQLINLDVSPRKPLLLLEVCGPSTSPSPGSWLEMLHLRPLSRTAESAFERDSGAAG